MKKLFLAVICSTAIFFMIGCGCGNDKTPEDFQVYNIELGGLTQEEFEVALREGVESYYINVTLDDDTFPVSAESIKLKYNEGLDLTDAVKNINKGKLTAEDIEAELFNLGTDNEIESGLKESYLAFLQAELSQGQALQQEADGESTVTTTVVDDDSSTSSDKSVTAGIASVISESSSSDINNAEEGEQVEIAVPTEEELAAIQQKIDDMKDPTRAFIQFSDDAGEYVGVDGVAGEAKDFSAATKGLTEAVSTMEEEVTLTTTFAYKEGELVSESTDIQEAIDEANSYLQLSIVHTFNSPNGKSGRDEISGSDIHNYLYVGIDGRTLEIDQDAITMHASSICKEYSDVKETKEEDSSKKKVTVTRKGYEASSQEIYTNIYSCLENKESGEFEAEYKEVNDSTTSDTGSTYVHVDLDAQVVTLYVNGEAIASGAVTSGCVYAGHATPAGTYYIYYKQRNTTLRGADYACFVNFWMPFNGGIGLHDASWKSTFGGTDYFYGGSHGCINMPYWLAETVYNNVSAGTKVVVTGGVTSLNLEDPVFSGSTTHFLKKGESVDLNITVNSGQELSYSSSNDSVATVDSSGKVTAVGKGEAYITVSSGMSMDGNYDKGSTSVYIQVTDPASETTAPTQESTSQEETTQASHESESSSTSEPSGE